jgi:hypothetical protein
MLKKVTIEHFRSCRHVEIAEIPSVLVLVGRNGAGKTNILRGIHFAAQNGSSTAPLTVQAYEGSRDGQPTRVVLEVELGSVRYVYAISYFAGVRLPAQGSTARVDILFEERLEIHQGAKMTVVFERKEDVVNRQGLPDAIRIGLTSPAMGALLSLLPTDDPFVGMVRPLVDYLARVRYYPLDEPSEVKAQSVLSSADFAAWLGETQGTFRSHDSFVLPMINMWLNRRQDFETLLKLVGPSGLGLFEAVFVDAVSVPKAGSTSSAEKEATTVYVVMFRPRGALEGVFDVRALSAGTRRVLRIMVSLVYDRSTVMLLEQPEDSIHGGLMRKVVDLLVAHSDPATMILASHSPSVFNSVPPESAALVTMDFGETRVRRLTPTEVASAKKFIQEEGSLADFLELVE